MSTATATLSGYGLPAWILGKYADHTYVKSSDGHVWPCWGRDSGGSLLVENTGDSTLADCLSQENSHAGLVYAVTGVCHQTSNRILFPAACQVDSAIGYNWSHALFSDYGRDLAFMLPPSLKAVDWEQRKQDCQGQAKPFLTSGDEDARLAATDGDSPLDRLNQCVADLESDARLTVEQRLGPTVEAAETNEIVTLYRDLFKHRLPLVLRLLHGEIDSTQFADGTNQLLNVAARWIATVISAETYERFFGTEAGEYFLVAYPETAAAYFDPLLEEHGREMVEFYQTPPLSELVATCMSWGTGGTLGSGF